MELIVLRNRYVLFLCSTKGARWGKPQAQGQGLLKKHLSLGGRGASALPATVVAARASAGVGVEPGGVWGPEKASSHRRVRTFCRNQPWASKRSHPQRLSTLEQHGLGAWKCRARASLRGPLSPALPTALSLALPTALPQALPHAQPQPCSQGSRTTGLKLGRQPELGPS